MSLKASFFLINMKNLKEVYNTIPQVQGTYKKPVEIYFEFLEQESKKINNYDVPAYTFAPLFSYLNEKYNIDLTKSELDSFINLLVDKVGLLNFIFTYEHKIKYAELLSELHFDPFELEEYYCNFSGIPDKLAPKYMITAINALRENLLRLNCENTSLLLVIN